MDQDLMLSKEKQLENNLHVYSKFSKSVSECLFPWTYILWSFPQPSSTSLLPSSSDADALLTTSWRVKSQRIKRMRPVLARFIYASLPRPNLGSKVVIKHYMPFLYANILLLAWTQYEYCWIAKSNKGLNLISNNDIIMISSIANRKLYLIQLFPGIWEWYIHVCCA